MIGIVLAAGAGRRFGGPKALAKIADGTTWVEQSIRTMHAAGIREIVTVIGSQADEVRMAIPPMTQIVQCEQWHEGIGASLRSGLTQLHGSAAEVAVITLVDLPAMPVSVIERLLGGEVAASTLRRMSYDQQPGHPVLVGRDHWKPLEQSLAGDVGAKDYLTQHQVELIEGADLWDGADIDFRPPGPTRPR